MMEFVRGLISKGSRRDGKRPTPPRKGATKTQTRKVNPVLLYLLGLAILLRLYTSVFPPLEEKVSALRVEVDQLRQVGDVAQLGLRLRKEQEELASLRDLLVSQGRYASENEGYSALYGILVGSEVKEFRLNAPEPSPSPHPLLRQFLLSVSLEGAPEKVASVLVQMREGEFRIKQMTLTPKYDDRGGRMSLSVDAVVAYFVAAHKDGR